MAARDLINIGISPDSGTGDSARRGGEKINNLFADIYSNFGDNPIGNDPNGPFYGYRRPFYEYEYKVGELHPAGKFTTVLFKETTGTPYDANYGFGVNGTGDWVDADGDGIPDIYRDSEWYFMTRGEAISADLTEIDPGGVAHLVLPLAKAGDIIKVRDTLGSWAGKYISVWTTPYEFQTTAQIAEWKAGTPLTTKVYPDSDSIAVIRADGSNYSPSYKRQILPAAIDLAYPNVEQKFQSTTSSTLGDVISNVSFFNKANTEIQFMYRGPDAGWIVKEVLLLSSFGQIDVLTDTFTEEEWVQWDQVDLTVNVDAGTEVEVTQGSWILPVAPATSIGGRDISAASIPTANVYRRMTQEAANTEALDQIKTFLGSKVGDTTLSPVIRTRVQAAYGLDSDGISYTTGFNTTDAANLYKEVTIQKIVDTSGNILLISQEPFDGYINLLVPAS